MDPTPNQGHAAPTMGSPKVHARGNRRLDALLDFLAFAARPMPLVTLLDEAPARIAEILSGEICSVYLLEGGGDDLVMRGNVGFASEAVGQVRLHVGEGVTGWAVEYMRPVSLEYAAKHASYKHFDELGEDRYPVFLAVPIRGKSGPLGALVVQRKDHPFGESDVELLASLGALVGAGIRHAELLDSQRDKNQRRTGGGTRKVTLPGRPVVQGRALGAMAAFRRPVARPSERIPIDRPSTRDEAKRLRGAFDVAEKALLGLTGRARSLRVPDAHFLLTYLEIVSDARFLERTLELIDEGGGIAQALSRVAREVTRTASSVTRDSFLEERAKDVEDLCDALSMLAATDKRAELPSKAILIGDGLTVFDLLVSARAHPVAVALTERAHGPRTLALLRLLGVPAIADVGGLFKWAADGDVAIVDADHGLLVINPSKSDIARIRATRKDIEDPAH